MVRAGPEVAPWDVVVDSCSVRAERGGELTGPNPTDRRPASPPITRDAQNRSSPLMALLAGRSASGSKGATRSLMPIATGFGLSDALASSGSVAGHVPGGTSRDRRRKVVRNAVSRH